MITSDTALIRISPETFYTNEGLARAELALLGNNIVRIGRFAIYPCGHPTAAPDARATLSEGQGPSVYFSSERGALGFVWETIQEEMRRARQTH